tara:strand:+ start:39004 stop:39177 length:174 start_codon:yes stop_codon:yes gene_type:complete
MMLLSGFVVSVATQHFVGWALSHLRQLSCLQIPLIRSSNFIRPKKNRSKTDNYVTLK